MRGRRNIINPYYRTGERPQRVACRLPAAAAGPEAALLILLNRSILFPPNATSPLPRRTRFSLRSLALWRIPHSGFSFQILCVFVLLPLTSYRIRSLGLAPHRPIAQEGRIVFGPPCAVPPREGHGPRRALVLARASAAPKGSVVARAGAPEQPGEHVEAPEPEAPIPVLDEDGLRGRRAACRGESVRVGKNRSDRLRTGRPST